MFEERVFWWAWSKVPGVGPVLMRRLRDYFGGLREAWGATEKELGRVEGFGRQTVEGVVRWRAQVDLEKVWREHLEKNPDFWTPADEGYPRLLLEIPNPPPVLYYRGVVDLAENSGLRPMVGVVGTREPSEYGRRWTRKICRALAGRGFTVVSGLAAGIDTEAHRGCLEAGGRTLAVMGTGVDLVYPPRNGGLYGEIVAGGAVLSEYPAGSGPDRAHFPQRNRIIAGLCRAVLVMEAPVRSGALITANLAADFGRDVFVLPGSLDNPNALGCLGLLSKGAQVILNEGLLLEMLGSMPPVDVPELGVGEVQLSLFEEVNKGPVSGLSAELMQVLQVVSSEEVAFDLIVEKANLPAPTVSSSLLQLELLGLVSQLPGMRYQRC
ncbi:MAG TPA: DNA-processing protein DprA [Halomicronema sp.]